MRPRLRVAGFNPQFGRTQLKAHEADTYIAVWLAVCLPSWIVAAPDEIHCLHLLILPGVDRAWCVLIIHLESYQRFELRLATLVNTENVCVEVLNL